MRVMERWTQVLERGGSDTYWAREEKFRAIEDRLGGFPAKRYYALHMNPPTIMWERDWESMAAFETAYESSYADPEVRDLASQPSPIVSEDAEIILGAG